MTPNSPAVVSYSPAHSNFSETALEGLVSGVWLATAIELLHNDGATNRLCVGTLVTQTHSEKESALLGEVSDDGTDNVCDRATHEHRENVAVHQGSRAVSAAQNGVTDLAEGQCILFMDAGDAALPHGLETLVRTAECENADGAKADNTENDRNSQLCCFEQWKSLVNSDPVKAPASGPFASERVAGRLWRTHFGAFAFSEARFRPGVALSGDMLFIAAVVADGTQRVCIVDCLFAHSVDTNGPIINPLCGHNDIFSNLRVVISVCDCTEQVGVISDDLAEGLAASDLSFLESNLIGVVASGKSTWCDYRALRARIVVDGKHWSLSLTAGRWGYRCRFVVSSMKRLPHVIFGAFVRWPDQICESQIGVDCLGVRVVGIVLYGDSYES